LIFDCDLSPSQLNAITDMTDLKVLDRTMLIMDIFARRAKSRGGKLQVELAQLKYSLPRLAKKQTGLSRLTGGIGGQGPGETKLEIDKRRVKDKIARLEREVEQLGGQRQLHRKQRNVKEVPTIAIVGYTNAGKSTLLNALTGADVYAKNELFATLDPTSRRLRFPKEREVVLIDTVGFIRDLPEGLINAFRATLEELNDADLLLHVVDATDPQKEQHIKVVEKILADLKIENTSTILVMNKCDMLAPGEAQKTAEKFGALPISAQRKEGLENLLNRSADELWHAHVTESREVWAKTEAKPKQPKLKAAKGAEMVFDGRK
jgi:GTP-binding protein HflX